MASLLILVAAVVELGIEEELSRQILVDGEVRYSNLTYEEVIAVTIGDLDKMEGIE